MTENRRVLHGAAPSAPVLVVAGLGDLWQYLFATAIALRKRAGAAVAFASRQALPDVLAERAGGQRVFPRLLPMRCGNPCQSGSVVPRW